VGQFDLNGIVECSIWTLREGCPHRHASATLDDALCVIGLFTERQDRRIPVAVRRALSSEGR